MSRVSIVRRKCPKPKKDKTANDMAMFVGVTSVESEEASVHATGGPSIGLPTIKDTFFDDWADDSWHAENGFFDVGGFQPFYADNTATEDPVMVELEDSCLEDQTEYAKVNVVTDELFVGSVGVDGYKQWLLDSGATCGVTYDKSKVSDMRTSDKMITIGNGDKIATLGQGTVTLTDTHGNLVNLPVSTMFRSLLSILSAFGS